jgi:hypothetical protein
MKTITSYAAATGTNRMHVWRAIQAGRLPARKLRDGWMIAESDPELRALDFLLYGPSESPIPAELIRQV